MPLKLEIDSYDLDKKLLVKCELNVSNSSRHFMLQFIFTMYTLWANTSSKRGMVWKFYVVFIESKFCTFSEMDFSYISIHLFNLMIECRGNQPMAIVTLDAKKYSCNLVSVKSDSTLHN